MMKMNHENRGEEFPSNLPAPLPILRLAVRVEEGLQAAAAVAQARSDGREADPVGGRLHAGRRRRVGGRAARVGAGDDARAVAAVSKGQARARRGGRVAHRRRQHGRGGGIRPGGRRSRHRCAVPAGDVLLRLLLLLLLWLLLL